MQPLAAALAKMAEGKFLTAKENKLIESSRYGQKVANELDTGNIRSGEFSTSWAKNINTSTINAEEYGILAEAAQIKTATDTLADALQSLRTQDNVQAQAGSQAKINEPAVNTAPRADTAESLEEASRKYGDGAKGFIAAYQQGQDIDKYESAYDAAYSMGQVDVPKAYLAKSPATAYLTETQREIAYIAGQAAGAAAAEANDAGNKANANGKRRRRTGAVKGENLKFSEMNKQQRLAYRVLSKVAAVTGVDIVLYKSEVGADGKYAGAQGEYRQSEPGTLRIDINAGLLESMDASDLSNYAMLRTFSHEFTHFIEKWNAKGYNELREAVFRTLEQNGENVEDLIDAKLGEDTSGKMSYDDASREVVAEAMTDILPDANFVEELATKHKNIFERLLDRLKAFVADIKEYYKTLGANRSAEANALKETVDGAIKYLDSIVNLFDRVAVEAVETFQSNHAIDESMSETQTETQAETTREVKGGFAAGESVQYSIRNTQGKSWKEQLKKYKHSDTLVVQEHINNFLAEDGILDLPLAVPVSVLSKAQKGKDVMHSISAENIQALPNGMKNAPIVIDNPSRSSIIFVTSIVDNEGLVTIAFKKNQVFDSDSVHKATTIHSRKDPIKMIEKLPESATVYANKNELNLVSGSSILESGTLKAKVKFINDNILHGARVVNDESVDSRKAKGDVQNQSREYLSEKKGRGYIGRSMSVNAANAYETGEKPLSKWSKTELVDAISSISENGNIEAIIKPLTVKELQDNFLERSSWHHTGAFFSETDFYSIDENAVSAINKELVDEIISERTRKYKTEAERLERIKNRNALYNARDIYTKLQIIEKAGILNLKTFNGIVNKWLAGEIAEGAYQQALKVLDDRLASAISTWEKLPQDHWRHESIAEYKADKEAFIKSYYIYNTPISNKNIQEIKTAILKKQADTAQKETARPEHVQYQSRGYLETEAAAFANDIDGWDKDGRPAGETFILGSTGEVMQGLGAIESDIYMHGDKINEILAEHPEMSLNEIQRIPEMLNDPVLIIKSKNFGRGNAANSRLVIFGAVKAQDGRPVMSVLDLRPVENRLLVDNMQKVTSAYTKDSNPVGFISKSEILYADKKRTPYLLKAIGFQMPITCTQSGFIGNISYKQRSVNIKGAQFTEVFETTDTQTQERSAPLTNREVLEYAASELGKTELTEGERGGLEIFKKHLDKLKGLHEQRDELGRLYKEQQFGKGTVNRAEAQKTLNNMKTLDGMIEKESNKLLEIENKPVLKKILEKSRKIIETEERTHGQELLRRYRARRAEAADVAKYRRRVKTEVDTLSKWILHPDNKNAIKHIPDAIKSSVIPFISGIDFTSKQQLRGGEATKADIEFVKKLNAVKNALTQNQDIYGMYSGYNDLPPDFPDKLQSFIDTTQELINNNSGEYVINRMTAAELKSLAQVVTTLKKFITQMNRFHQNAMFKHAFEAGDSSMEFMKPLSPAKHTGTISNFVLWQQIRPAYAFERFGKGGTAIYNELREAQGKLAFNTNEVIAFAERVYTTEEVKSWEKDTKTFELGGDTVIMPIANIMSFYELSKRPQAMKHILSEGIRVATFKHGLKEKISDVGHTLTEEDIKTIIGSLTPRQVEVADALQKFMSEKGGEWGNYVSMARFGEELFGEKEYFPIHSDNRRLKATAEETPSAASLYALLNMGFTKELNEKADNRILLYSIFDVFSNHMASMAQYNAFALPVLDTLKWFNYQRITIAEDGTKTKEGSVREEMARAFGTPEETNPGSGNRGYAESFVINMIKALNGTEAQGIPSDSLGMKALHRFNKARVSANLRVVMQQPLAITRAGLIIDYNSILKGLKLFPTEIKANIAEMEKHSGIAAWKALGFYDVNISRGLTQLIKHDSSVLDKIGDVGMTGAELADRVTWAAMWSACKEEVNRKQNNLKKGSDEYFKAVTQLFEDVIYKTQVVDSVLTKNEFLRSKGLFARLTGSFMSEPTTSASMLIEAFNKYQMDVQRGMTRREAFLKNSAYIGRTAYVYAITAILQAIVTAIADAWRDDDDYANPLEKILDKFTWNFIDEVVPLNKLPIGSDLYELMKTMLGVFKRGEVFGFEPRSVYMQWRDALIKGTKILYKKTRGEKTRYEWYGGIYKYMQVASDISGVPFGSLTREAIAIWNNFAGWVAPSMNVEKIRSYDASKRSQIKSAYLKGYLDEEEATAELIKQGIAKDENAAYWVILEFEATAEGNRFKKYDALYEAIQTDEGVEEVIAELEDHGTKPSNIRNKIRSRIGELYRGTEEEDASIDK